MADNLWIRFADGREKQVPSHLALDATMQQTLNFKPVNAPAASKAKNVKPALPKKKCCGS
jgi:hypothetical protein